MGIDYLQRMIDRARALHGPDRFLYDRSTWTSARTSMPITCRAHGLFWTKPYAHRTRLDGGCPGCREREAALDKLDARIEELAAKLRDTRKQRRALDHATYAKKLARAGFVAEDEPFASKDPAR